MLLLSISLSGEFSFVNSLYISKSCQLTYMKIILILLFSICSELELKPQGKLSIVVVKANALKNMEMIGKSDPYVVLYVRPMFKVKTKVVNNNLNPVWNETFELIADDQETQSIVFEVWCLSLLLL